MRALSYIYMTIILLVLILASFYTAINIFHVNFFKKGFERNVDCGELQGIISQVEKSCNTYGTCLAIYINLTEPCMGKPSGLYLLKIDKLRNKYETHLVKI